MDLIQELLKAKFNLDPRSGDDTWRKERTSSKLALQEIYGEVLWKAPKPGAAEKILVVYHERIRGNRSCSPDTWHSRRIESVDSL